MKDPIEVVEAAYGCDADEATWLRRVTESMQRNLAPESGVAACVYNARRADWIDVSSTAAVCIDPSMFQSMFSIPLPPGQLVQAFRRKTVCTHRQALAGCPALATYFEKVMEQAGLRETLCVNARNPTHVGCLFMMPFALRSRLAPRTANRLRRIAAHVATAFRARGHLARWSTALGAKRPEGVDAILRSDGAMEDADESAKGRTTRRTLRDAVLAVDRARGRLRRRAPDEALGIWQGLVDGRWSLLDHFESDGKRFVLAHRNEPETPDVRGLSPRERQVLAYAAMGHSNKEIAYELGLSISTVGMCLARVRAKLGTQLRLVIDAMRFGNL
jgi:DNA-binding CsgD family transcriptional regulator